MLINFLFYLKFCGIRVHCAPICIGTNRNNFLKAMDQSDHMIDRVIFFSVNSCQCKIWYQVKNLWDFFNFYNYKKCVSEKTFIFNLKNLRVHRPFIMPFLWYQNLLTWYFILHGQKFTDKKITISIIWSGWSMVLR